MKYYIFLLFNFLLCLVQAQEKTYVDYDKKSYEISSINVKGNQYSDANAIIGISGLRVGQKITVPGPEIPQAVKSIYKQRLFSAVDIMFSNVVGDVVVLEIQVTEKPRYSKHSFKGVKKGAHEELNELVNSQLLKNSIITEDVKENIVYRIKDHYLQKGYLDCRVKIFEFKEEKRKTLPDLL
ncbi:MAG: hypothetical protein IPO72_13520 [Saprospiraceae bacterium]|nr:hypothetical protein [Candidatus Vicinibacter affinis]